MNSDVLQEKKNKNSCVYVEQRESNTILAIVASLQRSEFHYSSSLTVSFGLFVPYYHVLEHPRLCLRYCSPHTALFPLPSRIDRSRLHVRDTFLSNKRFLFCSYEYHRRINVELYLHSCIRVNYLLAPATVLDTRFTGMLFSMSNVRWTTEHRTLVDFSQPPPLFFFLYSRKLFIRSFALPTRVLLHFHSTLRSWSFAYASPRNSWRKLFQKFSSDDARFSDAAPRTLALLHRSSATAFFSH